MPGSSSTMRISEAVWAPADVAGPARKGMGELTATTIRGADEERLRIRQENYESGCRQIAKRRRVAPGLRASVSDC